MDGWRDGRMDVGMKERDKSGALLLPLDLAWRDAIVLQRVLRLQKVLLGDLYKPLDAKLSAWFKRFKEVEEQEDFVSKIS